MDQCCKKLFFVSPIIIGIRIRRVKKVGHNFGNYKFHLNDFLPSFDRCSMMFTWYVHNIYIIYIIYRVYRWYFPENLKFYVQRSRFSGKSDKLGGIYEQSVDDLGKKQIIIFLNDLNRPVKKFTQARFSWWKFYLKERKLRQMSYCDKYEYTKKITNDVFTLDNLTRVILPR